MPRFDAFDGTSLAYHESGSGEPLVCLPGGPGRASGYFGELGGLSRYRRLIRLDLRGSGDSTAPADPGTYRCDRLVDDVEALRAHLGLDVMDLLAHSAGGDLGTLYAARHPARLRRLVLVTPGTNAAGITLTGEEFEAALARHADQPWYPDARAALASWQADGDGREVRARSAPLFYGGPSAAAVAHASEAAEQRSPAVAAGYYGDGAFDPPRTREQLAACAAPVLVVAGERDPAPGPEHAAELAKVFPDGRIVVLREAGHYPWVTHAELFVDTLREFLD